MTMSSRLRPRSASLKALPPDGSGAATEEPPSLTGAAVHWTVKSKDKPSSGGKGPRLLKSVPLKLPRGADASPSSSRSNSAGVGWGSGELLLDARQCARHSPSSSGPPSRGSSGGEAAANPGYPGVGGTMSRPPLQPPQSGQSAGAREKLSNTAPAAVGRPPVPTRPAPAAAESPSGGRPERRSGGKARSSGSARQVPTAEEEEPSPSRPGSSYERAKAVFESLPQTPGGTRTLVPDADGFIFRPAVEAEVKHVPRGQRRGPPPGGLISRSRNLAAALGVSRQSSAAQNTAQASLPQGLQELRDEVLHLQEEVGIPRPRTAWSESADVEEDRVDTAESEDLPPDMLEIAKQLRREFLVRHVMDDGVEAQSSTEADGESQPELPVQTGSRWMLKTDDSRQALGEVEASLAKAHERAERNRLELGSYLEGLRKKTFQADDDEPEEELLVSIPMDFEDVVDMNASFAASERRRLDGQSAPSRPTGDNSAAPAAKPEPLRMPAFLEKYFFEDKAAEQLPIVKLQLQEAQSSQAKEETQLEKAARQIAKLDALLAKREAEGSARVKASRIDLDATKERLRRDSEKSDAEKFDMLRKLKEKGMLRSSAPSCASSRVPSEPASTLHSARGSVASLVPATPTSPPGKGTVDWSGWACSNELALVPAASSDVPPTPTGADESSKHGSAAEEEPDTSTFNLTSTTADLTSLEGQRIGRHSQRQPQKARSSQAAAGTSSLTPVIEDAVPGDQPELEGTNSDEAEAEEMELEVPPLAIEDELYAADPYDLDAIRAIDDKLAKLVPEQEWEAKSIRSLPTGSEVSSAVAGGEDDARSKISKGRSVWSHLTSSSSHAPRDPVLREQHEDREMKKALVAIDDRLSELQDISRRPTEAPAPDEIQRLLLQATASQSAMPGAEEKVLALTAKAEDLQNSLRSLQMPTAVGSTALAVVQDGALGEARQILNRLAQNNKECDEVVEEAQFSLDQAERGLLALEADGASRPSSASKAAPAESEEPPASSMLAAVSDLAGKLEVLGREADELAKWEGPLQVQVPHQDSLDEEAIEGGREAEGVFDEVPSLPRLSGAGAALEEVDQDLESLLAGDLEGDAADDQLSDDDVPVRPFVPSVVELNQALDFDLPVNEGRWDDVELERLSKAMNQHFGDVPETLPDPIIVDPVLAEPGGAD